MRIMYWLIPCQSDSGVYSIRELRRKDAKAEHAARCHCESPTCGTKNADHQDCYGRLQKVEMEYASGFELMRSCLGEDRGMCSVVNDADDA